MRMLKERIYIGSSMVFELLASMLRPECHEKMLPQDQRKFKYVPEALTKWVEQTRAKLPDAMKKELNVFFNFESFLGLSLVQIIWDNHCYENIEDFFSFLERYPAKDLVKAFFNTGYIPEKLLPSVDNPIAIKNFLGDSSLPEVEKWKLTYFCSAPEETKERFIALIKNFYTDFFKEVMSSLQQYHRESISYMENILKEAPYKQLDKLIKFDLNASGTNDEIILFPSYYYNIASLFSYLDEEKRLIYIYGTSQVEYEFTTDVAADKVLTAIKVLGDESRVKIIEILNNSPCYGYELSQKLGISSSTISHHLSLLSDIGAINPVREENKVYYQVNKDEIRKLIKYFEDMLT